ncbi:MAG TPA: zinc-dependent alcohol dehydrogenase [Polyangiales bacterium]|jgi:S-(hydroxymethyl)glutathione dehydrogenase/alcohol dehydrogenase|nr:zinc-dependent alcohol dehydrogenase [Polyangiales bacterium]
MKALVFHTPKHVTVDTVPDPVIKQPRDAILRVTSTAICGSDLHIYNGAFPQPKPLVLGHEFMGIVEEVGPEVTNLQRGDRVVVPFPIACGKCWFCEHATPTQCENSNPEHYGPEGGLLSQKGGALFGYTDLYGGYDGGQAQFVRVPFADYGPRKVPESLTDDQVLFLSDIVPTAYSGLKWADVKPGETVAVIGCGPVGLQALKLARILGASKVIGVDILPYRLEKARTAAGAEVVNAAEVNAVEAIRALTDGRGADVVIEAVGMEVERSFLQKVANVAHLQRGSITAVEMAFSAVRRQGRVSIMGVYGTTYDNFPLGQMLDKGLRVQTGQATVHNFIDELMQLIVSGKLKPDDIISHRLPLDKAPDGYRIFNKKEENCTKVVLKPWD